MQAFLTSSKTNIIAGLIILCSGTAYFDVLGPKYSSLLMLFCGVLAAFGFIASKDANVSNSPTPVAATVVSAANEAKPNPASPAHSVIHVGPGGVSAILLLVGAGLLAGCESLPFLQAKDQIESLVTVYAAGSYTVSITKDERVLYTETWDCTSEAGKMTGCHKRVSIKPTAVEP